MGIGINFQIPKNDTLGFFLRLGYSTGPPQHSFDVCQHHVNIEWLGDVVICAQFETDHFIQFTAAGSQKNNRQIVVGFHPAQRVQTIHTRQADIKNYQIGGRLLYKYQGIFCGSCRVDVVTGLLQMECQTATHKGVIIDKKDIANHKDSLHLNWVGVNSICSNVFLTKNLLFLYAPDLQ